MNILLGPARLTYIIADEVLQITTKRNAQGQADTARTSRSRT